MSEKVNDQITDQPTPSKEEIMSFFQEQIDVKRLQVELQELNAKLAKGRAEELQALNFIANMTNPDTKPVDRGQPHIVTQDDLDANPELVEAGVQVGDEVLIPSQPLAMPTESSAPSRKLKKS